LHLLTQSQTGSTATLRDSLNVEERYRVHGAGITDERLYLHVMKNWTFDNGEAFYERLLPYALSAKGFEAGQALSFDGSFTLLHVGEKRPMLSLNGDGVLTLNGQDVQKMRAVRFSRTLGWTYNAALLPPHGYVAAGNFGTQHVRLDVLPAGAQL